MSQLGLEQLVHQACRLYVSIGRETVLGDATVRRLLEVELRMVSLLGFSDTTFCETHGKASLKTSPALGHCWMTDFCRLQFQESIR